MEKKLYRSRKDQKLCGVCAGIAKFFKLDPTIVRLIWTLAVLVAGSGVLLYIACALVIPEEPEDDYVTVE
jgi:phage shock protein PspC (stress-responsive transcriptional regulator)